MSNGSSSGEFTSSSASWTQAGAARSKIALSTWLADGIDVAALENGTAVPASVREDILALNQDEETRAELNAMVNRALRIARDEAGLPVYLQAGPLYWGYWTADDKEALGLE